MSSEKSKTSYTVVSVKDRREKKVTVKSDATVQDLLNGISEAFGTEIDSVLVTDDESTVKCLTRTIRNRKCTNKFNSHEIIYIKLKEDIEKEDVVVVFGNENKSVQFQISGRDINAKMRDLERQCREHFMIDDIFDVELERAGQDGKWKLVVTCSTLMAALNSSNEVKTRAFNNDSAKDFLERAKNQWFDKKNEGLIILHYKDFGQGEEIDQMEREILVFDKRAESNKEKFVVVHVHTPWKWSKSQDNLSPEKRDFTQIMQFNIRHTTTDKCRHELTDAIEIPIQNSVLLRHTLDNIVKLIGKFHDFDDFHMKTYSSKTIGEEDKGYCILAWEDVTFDERDGDKTDKDAAKKASFMKPYERNSDLKNVPGWRWQGTGKEKGRYWNNVMSAVSNMLKSNGKNFKYNKISSNDIRVKDEIERVVRQLTGGHGSKKGIKVNSALYGNGKRGLKDRVICIMGVIGILNMSKKFVLRKAVEKEFKTSKRLILKSVGDSTLDSILTCKMPQVIREQVLGAVLYSQYEVRHYADRLHRFTAQKLSPQKFLCQIANANSCVTIRDKLLEEHGLKIKTSYPDGHCLYHSIAGQIEMKNVKRPDTLKDVEDYVLLRHLCADYMKKNESRFKIVCTNVIEENNLDFNKYIEGVRGNMWGGGPEISALSEILNRKVEVWHLYFDSGQVKLKKMDIEDGKNNEDEAKKLNDDSSGTSNDLIRLLYNGQHYDALVRIENMKKEKLAEKMKEKKNNSSSFEKILKKSLAETDELMRDKVISDIEHEHLQEECLKQHAVQTLLPSGLRSSLQKLAQVKNERGSKFSQESYSRVRQWIMKKYAELRFS